MLHGLPLGRARFDSGEVCFHHLPVTRQSKEQRHVDADAFADQLLDGGQSVGRRRHLDRKSTRLNCSHRWISYGVFCLKKGCPSVQPPCWAQSSSTSRRAKTRKK